MRDPSKSSDDPKRVLNDLKGSSDDPKRVSGDPKSSLDGPRRPSDGPQARRMIHRSLWKVRGGRSEVRRARWAIQRARRTIRRALRTGKRDRLTKVEPARAASARQVSVRRQGLPGQPFGRQLENLGGRFLHARGAAAQGRAVDSHPRQPRNLQARRARLRAATRSDARQGRCAAGVRRADRTVHGDGGRPRVHHARFERCAG